MKCGPGARPPRARTARAAYSLAARSRSSRNALSSGCPPYSPMRAVCPHHPMHRHDDRERASSRTPFRLRAPRADCPRAIGDLAVAGRLAVGDAADGLEGVAREAADEPPVQRQVEVLPLAREVLVELLGGVGGDRVVIRAIGDAAQHARQPLEFGVEPVAQRMQGDDALVGRDDEDLADGGGVQAEATVRRCGHATILRAARAHAAVAAGGRCRGGPAAQTAPATRQRRLAEERPDQRACRPIARNSVGLHRATGRRRLGWLVCGEQKAAP